MTFLLLALFTAAAIAQDVDLKKGIVYVDGKECMKYDGKEVPGFTFSSMGGEGLFFIGFARDVYGRTYWHVSFLKQKGTMNYCINFISKKAFIKKLVQEKVLLDCNYNVERQETFITKYDERVE